MEKKTEIKTVLDAMMEGIQNENSDKYDQFRDHPSIESARKAIKDKNPEEFYYLFLYEMDGLVDGLLERELTSNMAMFLFKHANFVESHLSNLFEQFEGRGCSADKSRTVVKALASRFLDNKPIQFNYEAECTYHLPKKILKEEVDIVEFYNALKHLYHGNPGLYLKALQNITRKLAEGDNDDA